mgnify:FL=1
MDILQLAPLTLTTTKAGVSAGTTSTLSTANTVIYGYRGKAYSKAAITNQATPIVDHTTNLAFNGLLANQGCIFVLSFDVAGVLRVSQGPVGTLDVAGKFIYAPNFPTVFEGDVPFAYLVALAGSTAVGSWIFGTNNLSAVAGLTYNFQDVFSLPDRLQVV